MLSLYLVQVSFNLSCLYLLFVFLSVFDLVIMVSFNVLFLHFFVFDVCDMISVCVCVSVCVCTHDTHRCITSEFSTEVTHAPAHNFVFVFLCTHRQVTHRCITSKFSTEVAHAPAPPLHH